MQSFWALPLSRQLLLAIVLLLVPVVVATAWSILDTRRERLTHLEDEAASVGRTVAAHLGREVAVLDLGATQIIANPAMRTFESEGLAALFERLLSPSERLAGIALTRADGSVVAAAGVR